jgi:hypothetical protein
MTMTRVLHTLEGKSLQTPPKSNSSHFYSIWSCLQEEGDKRTNGGQAEDGRHAHRHGRSAALAVAAAAVGASAGGVVVGVLVVAGAVDVATITGDLVAELLELLARGVDVLGGGNLEDTTDVVDGRELHIIERSTENDGTANHLQLGEGGELLELGVVGNGETATDLGQLREADVLDGRVADEREITSLDLGQVKEGDSREEVGVETERTVDGGQRGAGVLGDVRNSSVGEPLDVGHFDAQLQAVGVDVESVAQALDAGGELGEELVVVDVHILDGLDVDALQAAQASVGDDDGISLLDTLGTEVEGSKAVQGEELQASDRVQRGEGQVGQLSSVLQAELLADLSQRAGLEADNDAVVLASQITTNLGKLAKVKLGIAGHNHNTALNSLAATKLSSVTGGRNLDLVITATEGHGASGHTDGGNRRNNGLGEHLDKLLLLFLHKK